MGGERPLAGVMVLDLMWVMAGPAASRVLADYGATVIHVESTKHIDTARTMAPFLTGLPGPENSALFQTLNAGKYGVTLDLSRDEGRAVVRDLAQWADVVMESFSPKVMRAWGLDYDSLRAVKPELIMLSTCLMGQTGPLASFAGFGSLASAISGFHNLTGWPDRPPAGPFGAYTDTFAPRFTGAAVLAALEYRRRTGKGQYIDQSQSEAALHFLAPALLDYEVNGNVAGRLGNRDLAMAPHGVYPTASDERWVAIAVAGDEQWRRLCDEMGRPELGVEARFATASARLAHQDDLDDIVATWTREHEAGEIEGMLQACGVAASLVEGSGDLAEDEQLRHRRLLVEVEHEVHGTIPVEGSRIRLSATSARIERSAPTFGRDNHLVLREVLGYSEERIAALVAAGVLE
jgi:benzylsuccinate CoA-transferase BbsF subunit